MRSSDFLFNLIKSLSKGERRNFKLFARLQEGDKKYIQLFDAINSQGSYNEKKLLQYFKDERFTKQFSVPKNYLYNYLLKTLTIFQKDQQSELTNLLSQVRVLLSKNLFQQAHKLVRKGTLLAKRQERFLELIELLHHERNIYKQTKKLKEFRAFIFQIQEQELETIAKLRRLQEYEHLYDEIQLVLGKSESGRSLSDINSFEHILKNDLIVDDTNATSIRAKIRRLDILIDINRYTGDFSQSLELTEKVIAAYDKNTAIKREDNLRYIISLCNLAICYFYQEGKETMAKQILQKLRNTEVFTAQEELRVYEKYYYFSMALAGEKGDVQLGLNTLSEMEGNFKRLEGKIRKSEELGIYYCSAYFHLIMGEPDKALAWVNRILNEPKTELRTDLQTMAQILNLIIHYELGNLDLIDNNIKSTTRFLHKKDRLYSYEKSILRLIKKLSDTYGTFEDKAILENFLPEVEKILKDPFEEKATKLFDIRVWAQSQLTNTKMVSIISKNVTSNSVKA